MIDTIALTLSRGHFHIAEPDKFEGSAKRILNDDFYLGSRAYDKVKQNPSKKELLSGIYKPKLTLTKRFNHTGRFEPTLKIELSLPKLFFKNNFDELENKDFDEIVRLLKQALNKMGVWVGTYSLTHAPVSAVHYSKNIILTNGLTPHYYISKIKEANVSLALDVTQTDYINSYGFKWHANSYELAFYDKIQDLRSAKTSDKRAIEKDSAIQLNLFENLVKRQCEVLRMEIRLNRRQKIGKVFRELGINKELTFQNLFDMSISQKILLYYLKNIESKRLRILDMPSSNAKDTLTSLIIHNPKIRPQKALQLLGLRLILKDTTLRELRAMFGNQSNRGWYRLIAEVQKIILPPIKSPFLTIRENLIAFEPVKLVDF